MRESDHVESLSPAARAGRLLLFCGAGVSMLAPSKSPSWWEIYVAAATALANRFREGFPEISEELQVDELLKPLQTQQLADLIVSGFAGDTFVEVLKAVDVADANENHMLIAALAAASCLRGVVTTNFDTLLERTAAIRGVSWAVTAPGIAADRVRDRRTPLIKLHGSSVDAGHLIETSSQKAREISPELAAAWDPILEGSDLLVLGYSGADLNFGAAGAFFQDFAVSGGRIWWLYRTGEKPTLTKLVRERATLVEGALPNLLQDLTEAVGASRFETPVAGRDAQLALRNAMEAWSREVHIGRWGAALFFYALGHFTGGNVRDSPLNLAIEELSREKVASLTSGAKVAVEDWGVAGFLSEVGRQAMGRAACEEAIPLLRAAVNLYENYHRWLSDSGHEGSFPERQMNLATSWGNYAQALLMTGKFKVALAAFTRSLQHAYLGGHSDSFLIGITNILHYGSGFKEVRRCMRIVDAGIRTADRLGSVQSSIELRLLLAGYHIDRNEIWAGADVLKEAGRRAVAVHDRNVLFVRIMEGHLLLKQGRIQEGLTAIADTVSAVPHAAFVHYPTDEVRKHLDLLGIEQKGPFIIELVHDQIPDLVKKIEQEVADAKANKQLPWQGRHCSVSESSGLGQDYMRLLFELGVAEFEGNTKKAIRLGLNLAEIMLESRYSHDARWAAINVLANPAALAEHRGPAHSLLAQANAELGYIEEVVADLRQAVQDFEKAGQTIPLRTLETGMWHAIQSLEGKAAAHWAAMLGAALSGEPERDARCADVAAKIDTWGQPMAEVGDAFRRAASSAGINLPTATVAAEGQRPFRRFVGVTAEVRGASDEQVDAMLREAQNALAENDPDRALALLDGLASRDLAEVPEHQAGIALALQIQGLSAKAAPAELDLAMDRQRERLVAELAFSALTRLETSMVWAAIFHGEPALAADILAKHSFVAEFSVDPLARVSLFAWEAQFAYLRNQALRSKRAHFASVAAHYFGTAETQFLRAAAAPDSEEALPRLPSTPGEGPAPGRALSGADTIRAITKEFLQTLDEADESSGADAAMTTAVRALRRRRLLTPWVLANLRDRRAGWALQARRLDEAVQLYRKAARTFRLAKENEGVLNAMAGEARALSRSGDYGSAVQVFERALVEAKDLPVRSTLLLGLASAHLMEATERHGEIDPVLTDKAVATYREAIKTTPLDARERPLARLGLARALGQKGEQVAALAELDQAVAELAHLGSPSAKILLENRKTFERGEWRALGLY